MTLSAAHGGRGDVASAFASGVNGVALPLCLLGWGRYPIKSGVGLPVATSGSTLSAVFCGGMPPDCVCVGEGCIGRAGASEAGPEAVRQAVGGGCQSGWGRSLSVTNAIETGTWRQGDSGWA